MRNTPPLQNWSVQPQYYKNSKKIIEDIVVLEQKQLKFEVNKKKI